MQSVLSVLLTVSQETQWSSISPGALNLKIFPARFSAPKQKQILPLSALHSSLKGAFSWVLTRSKQAQNSAFFFLNGRCFEEGGRASEGGANEVGTTCVVPVLSGLGGTVLGTPGNPSCGGTGMPTQVLDASGALH